MKFSYIKVYSVVSDIVVVFFLWILSALFKKDLENMFACFLILLTHNVYFCIGFSEKAKRQFTGWIFEVFPALTETSVHLAGLDICCDCIKQSQPGLKLSNNLKRRHISLNLVVSSLFGT